jgi:dTDP-L-rhamnose 4-epimerase
MSRVLVTGGAGFIGSHVGDLLLSKGSVVRVLDNLSPQVHEGGKRPSYLSPDIEFMVGDVRNSDAVEEALRGVDAVIHLAAAVGVGQSMYEITSYTANNDLGTAVLLEALTRHPVERFVCASSMSIYGEGLARSGDGRVVEPADRSVEQMRRGEWELCDATGNELTPLPTPESKRPSLNSVYALNKYVQERLSLVIGGAYDIPTVALRFFNVYGPRQALSNPYTGVLAIFAARLLNGRAPPVFEDGNQRRDFVHVRDVANACLLALQTKTACGKAFNIGSGQSRSIRSVAEDLARVMSVGDLKPDITGRYRAGDIRHCFADVSRSRRELGFEPKVRFDDGLFELAEWLGGEIAEDRTERATAELASRGLVA